MRLTSAFSGAIVVAIVVAVCGCQQPVQTAAPDAEAARAAIRQADLAFDRAVADRDVDRFRELLAVDAAFYSDTGVTEGSEAVVAEWAPLFDPASGISLTWEPHAVEVASSGDLGYTRGSYVLTTPGEDGTEVAAEGRYVTIWRQAPDGGWRAAVDIGTPPQPRVPVGTAAAD